MDAEDAKGREDAVDAEDAKGREGREGRGRFLEKWLRYAPLHERCSRTLCKNFMKSFYLGVGTAP